jgi:hypothetical protein
MTSFLLKLYTVEVGESTVKAQHIINVQRMPSPGPYEVFFTLSLIFLWASAMFIGAYIHPHQNKEDMIHYLWVIKKGDFFLFFLSLHYDL